MSPCLTPLLIDISSDRVPLKLTLAFIPLWRERIRPTNLSGQPNFSNIFQRVNLLTVSKAFDKSMKHWYNGRFCSYTSAIAERWKSYPRCHGLHENRCDSGRKSGIMLLVPCNPVLPAAWSDHRRLNWCLHQLCLVRRVASLPGGWKAIPYKGRMNPLRGQRPTSTR